MAEQSSLFSSLLTANTPRCRSNISSLAARRSIGLSSKSRRALDGTPVQTIRFDDSYDDSFSGRSGNASTHMMNYENSYAGTPGRGHMTSQRGSYLTDITRNVSDYESVLDFNHTNLLGTPDRTTDITATTAMIMSEEDPSRTVANQLCQEFRDLYVEYSGEHEVFNLLLRYEEACSQGIHYLTNIVKKAGSLQQKFLKTSKVLRELRAERDTWRLVRILFKDRLESEHIDEEDALMDTLGKRLSDKDIVDNFYQKNSFIRQCQLVVDWLEKNAADDFDETCFEKMEHFSDQGVAWEHTLHTLLDMESNRHLPTVNHLITEMDPDAPLRQKDNTLSDIDKESDMHLLRFMFLCLRAGNLDGAQKLAEKYGQPWLAAALEGWRLHHDANYNNGPTVEGETLQPVEGNEYRDIWKSVCWNMALDGNVPLYEKAMFAALSGNLRALLPACVNWVDYLWAYFRVLVDQHIEEELYSNTQQERSLENLPPLYWDKVLDVKQIFQDIKASESEAVRTEGELNLHIVQKFIILDDINGLIEQLFTWLRNEPSKIAGMMRFTTHLIYFLRVIGRSSKEEICVAILESYVEELIESHSLSLVAAYAATLPPPKQVVWYAKFLEGITDNKERQQCLQYAEEAGLNVPVITKTVVENVRDKDITVAEAPPGLTVETTEEDKKKIESIDWLVFDPTQRSEALKQANALMRIFVACKKLDAAKQVFMKIPPDSLALLMEQWNKITGNTELSAEDDNAVREYLCFKAYLEAHDAFNDWFNHFQHAKPVCPEPLTGDNIKFKDKVAHEHQVREYQTELERWEAVLWTQTKTTTDRLYNMLLFVDGGWMVDQRAEDDVDEGRQKQMSLLRKLCIPQITILLHNVLHHTGQYRECIQLADVFASEKNQLYKEFSVQELQNLLSVISESSILLLDKNFDPLGYTFK